MSARLPVREGEDKDKCPLCGIWRVSAGYLKETCGDGITKPGCFVLSAPSLTDKENQR